MLQLKCSTILVFIQLLLAIQSQSRVFNIYIRMRVGMHGYAFDDVFKSVLKYIISIYIVTFIVTCHILYN